MLTEQLGYGKGSHLHREFAEVMALKHTDSTGGLMTHFLSSRWARSYLSPASPESEKSISESLYLERRNSPSECGVTQYFWLLAIFKFLHLDLKTELIGYRFLSSLAQTLFWEQIHHPSRIRGRTGCFPSCNGNGHPERLLAHAPVIPY